MKEIIIKPSAYLPFIMSAAALLWTIGYLTVVGIPQEQVAHDEGTGARIFQLLMVGQLPIIINFVFKWLPRKPKETLAVLLLQALAALIPFATVYFLEL